MRDCTGEPCAWTILRSVLHHRHVFCRVLDTRAFDTRAFLRRVGILALQLAEGPEPQLLRVYGRRTQGTTAFRRARGRQARRQLRSHIHPPSEGPRRGTAGCGTAETCRASATEASRAAADAAEQ